ncbi:uncharacterized protein LOC124412720 [Diprion similis]|uniref:uncharacterized protein LOC124412720 n=1 Tax=Diprion similis TaxID=362088 RepID=UPI001EF7AD6C|nr:uncharacterized protein LOC124412720 [Diprion similis]
MPKHKQPTLLQEMAFDLLVTHFVEYCQQQSSYQQNSRTLRESIVLIKKQLFPRLPPNLSMISDFCTRFFDAFQVSCWKGSSAVHRTNRDSYIAEALEMMMDVKILRLQCTQSHLYHLDHNDFHRFQGLQVLQIHTLSSIHVMPGVLGYFCLENLTELHLPKQCTNLDLKIIGSRCPLLQVLDINDSPDVDDEGLRALQPCSDLRVIDFCFLKVSNDGVNELLSAHKKLEEFNVRITVRPRVYLGLDFDVLSRPKTLVCPSIKRYCILRLKPVTNAHLLAIVALFPNLIHLRIYDQLVGDLRILQKLERLKELDLSDCTSRPRANNLRQLLTVKGENISSLGMKNLYRVGFYLTQSDLDFIYKFCKNIESLKFVYERQVWMDTLVVPPFPKLKILDVEARRFNNNGFPHHAVIQFGEMLQLEILRFENFGPTIKITESIMFDNVRFPNLKKVLCGEAEIDGARRINKIARDNNLDFSMECQPWLKTNWDRLGFLDTGWILH